jgi:hypothetical protein
MNIMKNRREFLLLAAATPMALLEGCAKVPSGGVDGQETRYVIVRMRVAGRIRQTTDDGLPYSYFFLVNFVDDINNDSGPAPVVQQPWGNGFAAPAQLPANSQGFVGFVVFGGPQSQGQYGVYEVPAANGTFANVTTLGPGLNGFLPRGTPDSSTVPQPGGNELIFRLNLNIFRNSFYRPNAEGTGVRLPNFLQFNFVNTDNFPQDPNDPNALKTWDSLGNANLEQVGGKGVPGIVRGVPLNQTGLVYDNSRIVAINPNSVEGQGDVWLRQDRSINEPDLDIVEWSVQVTSS